MSFEFFFASDMLAKMFWSCAIAGTMFFVLRVILMFSGGELNDGADAAEFSDASDIAFEMFSVNSITAFIMMFGWAGLTAYVQYQLNPLKSIFIAFASGVFAFLITAYLFKLAMSLVSRGSEFRLESLVGMNVKVYQQIPANGEGKIQVSVPNGMTREVVAVSADKVLIESFKVATVISVVAPDIVSVREL